MPAHAGAHVAAVTREAFVSALGTGLTIGSSVTLAGAVVALALIQRTASRPAAAPAERETTPDGIPAERPATPAGAHLAGEGGGAESAGELTLI